MENTENIGCPVKMCVMILITQLSISKDAIPIVIAISMIFDFPYVQCQKSSFLTNIFPPLLISWILILKIQDMRIFLCLKIDIAPQSKKAKINRPNLINRQERRKSRIYV